MWVPHTVVRPTHPKPHCGKNETTDMQAIPPDVEDAVEPTFVIFMPGRTLEAAELFVSTDPPDPGDEHIRFPLTNRQATETDERKLISYLYENFREMSREFHRYGKESDEMAIAMQRFKRKLMQWT